MSFLMIIGIAIKLSLFLVVLSFGLAASFGDVLYLFRRPSKLIRALVSINVIMPVFVGLMIALFNFQPVVEIALVALSVSPVPPILPNRAFKTGGGKSFTFGLLAAASLLSLAMIPLVLNIFAAIFRREAQFSEQSVITTILTSVILPFAVGMSIRHFAPDFSERVAAPLGKIAMIILLLAALPIVLGMLPVLWEIIGNGTILAIAAFALVGVTFGHFLGGPDPHERSVLALATSSRHPAIAIALTSANVDETETKLAMGAIILYILVSGIVAAPYLAWLDKDRSEEKKEAV